ncbi:hypothetical protein AVEN_202254-1 [Araneus ventricosus]|uniref:Uncharacterized protein n=1 Tax=Araneus ventricosus TaxID=182803 RepID=A0A4Y2CMI0_ARAVE|nr:hypothetical protein AVEN_202254-1 [Araneus ventricosus]
MDWGKVSASGLEGSRFPTRFLLTASVWGWCMLNLTPRKKHPSTGVARKYEEGVLNQVSPSSSDIGSKLRGPSQNSPCEASKRVFSKTE